MKTKIWHISCRPVSKGFSCVWRGLQWLGYLVPTDSDRYRGYARFGFESEPRHYARVVAEIVQADMARRGKRVTVRPVEHRMDPATKNMTVKCEVS